MDIIKFEIKRNYKVTLIWAVAVSLAATVYISMSPLFIDQADTIMGFLSSLGEDLVAGLGINFDNFFTPIGYFSYIGGYLFAALGVQAMIYGIKSFAKEKNQKSVEFLYTKPVTRTKLFVSKTVANIILLTISQAIVIASIMISTDVFNDVDYDQALMFKETFALVPLQYMFLGLGTLIGCSVDRFKNIVSASIMVSVGMYIINMLATILDSDMLGYISFFNYYNLNEIVSEGNYNGNFVFISLVIIIVLLSAALTTYNKRDIKGV